MDHVKKSRMWNPLLRCQLSSAIFYLTTSARRSMSAVCESDVLKQSRSCAFLLSICWRGLSRAAVCDLRSTLHGSWLRSARFKGILEQKVLYYASNTPHLLAALTAERWLYSAGEVWEASINIMSFFLLWTRVFKLFSTSWAAHIWELVWCCDRCPQLGFPL